jgi:hypothetical protein
MATRDCATSSAARTAIIDEYDDDAINFMEGEAYRRCSECRGTGGHTWCRECGWDATFKRFLAPEYQQDWLVKEALAGRQGLTRKCSDCQGTGTMNVTGFVDGTGGCRQVENEPMRCLHCGGTGRVSMLTLKLRRIGKFVREARVEMRISQREQAKILGMSFVELNDLQHGRISAEV